MGGEGKRGGVVERDGVLGSEGCERSISLRICWRDRAASSSSFLSPSSALVWDSSHSYEGATGATAPFIPFRGVGSLEGSDGKACFASSSKVLASWISETSRENWSSGPI